MMTNNCYFVRTSKQNDMEESRDAVWREWQSRKGRASEIKKLSQGAYGAVFKACVVVEGEDRCIAAKPSCDQYGECQSDGRSEFIVTSDEAYVGKLLTDERIPGIIQTLAIRVSNPRGLEIDDSMDAANIYMELVKPFELKWHGNPVGVYKNLDQLAALGNPRRDRLLQHLGARAIEGYRDRFFASVVVQVAYTLVRLREAFPGFRHNDLHVGNIMLTNWGPDERIPPYRFGDRVYIVPRTAPKAVMIDFGMVAGPSRLFTSEAQQQKRRRNFHEDSPREVDETLGWGFEDSDWHDITSLLLSNRSGAMNERWATVLDREAYVGPVLDPTSQYSFRNPRNTPGWMDSPQGGKQRWPARMCKTFVETTQAAVNRGVCKTLEQWVASSDVIAALVPLAPPPLPGVQAGEVAVVVDSPVIGEISMGGL